MKIVNTSVYECENQEEYDRALEMIEADIEDMNCMNAISGTSDTLEIKSEDKEKFIITTIGTYYC